MTIGPDEHAGRLAVLCRICGKQALEIQSGQPVGKRRYKSQFACELKDLYGIDIDCDKTDIHPEVLCQSDANKLYRFRQCKRNGKLFQTVNDVRPYSFTPHSAD